RRVRPEFAGEFLHHWDFMLAGDWGAPGGDNGKGTNQISAGPPPGYAGTQTTTVPAPATAAFPGDQADPPFNPEFGQFDAPFTMENRTSDKFFPFMERSLAVRVLGIPTNKEIGGMAWGETSEKLFHYEAGIFNGDGQNRLNVDNRADFMGRVFVR